MSSLEIQEKQVILNSQFQDNQELIERLQNTLLQDIAQWKLLEKEFLLTEQFIHDKASVFRSLKENNFSFDDARTNLLATVQWRLDNNIDQLNMNDCLDFVENGFAFFHGTDNAGDHPLLFVRLGCFPKYFRDSQKSLTEHVKPYAAFIMEIARKLTWDKTQERIKQGHPFPLVSRMTVLVNVTKSPILPVNAELIRTMSVILNERFPSMIQSINVLNFGWMYQGVWSVLKYLLTEEAKSFIRFTTIQELKSFISSDRILKELGGLDEFNWSIENDEILQKYGKGYIERLEPELPNTPPLSSLNSRSSSQISSSDSNDEFFDAEDTMPFLTQQPQLPLIVPPSQALTVHEQQPIMQEHPRSIYSNLSPWAGLRTGIDFLTSFIDTKTHHIPNDTIIVNPVSSTQQLIAQHHFLYDIEVFSKNLIHQLLHISFGPNQGLAYWVVLYLFLRGPVESIVKKSLVHTSLVESRKITSTTIGITAAVAALAGSGLTSTLEKFRR